MNKRQKEILQLQLDSEKHTLEELKQVYIQALKDCEKKIAELSSRKDMENLQSIIYQKQYQQALKGQLEGALEQLHSNEYATVSDYLSRCYEDGYIGVMYDLQGQGIPVIMPIDQEQATQAIQTNSKLSKPLYDRLGEDVNKLKRSVRAEVSRGIANGSTWNEIAGKLAMSFKSTPFNSAYNKAMTIARTEGHRIQIQSADHAQHVAKEKGANVEKQWDATLDDKTRDSHRIVDGEIRELDERFSNGLMYPGDPSGPAAEVVNCRCALLQRAKWALDDAELDTLKERAAYFGLDKTKNFEEYKEKYLKIQEAQKISEIQDFASLEKYLKNEYNINIDNSVKELNFSLVRESLSGVENVIGEYPELANQIEEIVTSTSGVMSCTGKKITFNPDYYGLNITKLQEKCKEMSDIGWWIPNCTPESIGVHETAHAVEWLIIQTDKAYLYDFERTIAWNNCSEARSIVKEAVNSIKKTEYGKGRSKEMLINIISGYANDSDSEAIAESFADVYANGDNANPLSIEIKKVTEERYRKYKEG